MKKLLTLALVCIITASGFYAYQQHKRSELLATVVPMVKNASIRITNSTKLDTDTSHATYKELFDRIEADTAEIEKRSVDMQSISTAETAAFTDPAITYLRDCQEVSRALSMKYRKRLAFSNAIDSFDESLSDMKTSTSYGLEYARQRNTRALESLTKAGKESSDATTDLVSSAKKLKDSRAKLTTFLPDDALVPVTQIDALIAKNVNKDDKAKAEQTALKQ